MLPPEVLNFVHAIQIKTNHLAKGLLSGIYRSTFKGHGLEFFETREYQPGDEIRHIDWNQTSRTNRLHVKTFQEERRLNIILMLDLSASHRFGTNQKLKSQLMVEVAAVLAFAALRNNDKVGLILYTDKVEEYVPPRQNLRHILRLIRDMLLFQPTGKGTDTAKALQFLGQLQLKPGICFLLSDFLTPDFSHDASLIAQKHDLIAIAISDPGEKRLPPLPLAQVHDLETDEELLVSLPSESEQERVAQSRRKLLLENRKRVGKAGGDFLELSTDRPYLPLLQKFFQTRRRPM